ncbi:hypothetical protein [Burkholderia sp. A2]|uniref:hypothetical protein n=1 Tax=Burkholderia sp. A2 TaxID=236253 RepID=UPI00210A5BE4|nr:hypothetical protein [Burkholderia sp. A2]
MRAFTAPSGGLSGLPNEAAFAVTAMPAAAMAPAVLVNILRRERFVMISSSFFAIERISITEHLPFFELPKIEHPVTQVKSIFI